jgi:hypothetical protein
MAGVILKVGLKLVTLFAVISGSPGCRIDADIMPLPCCYYTDNLPLKSFVNAPDRGVSIYGSGCVAVIVGQHAAQALPALDLSCASELARFWADELVR